LNSDPDHLVYHRDHQVNPLAITVVSVTTKVANGCQVSGITRLRTTSLSTLIPLLSICRFLTQNNAPNAVGSEE
jgi:hypothetical protein